ncbi:putative PIN family toxin of toxin-antitoxin system [Rhizobium aquaticum]|uniref:PIN family toxin of toxin-antitoxin system n=1 Tax=Rhizobium aquaticum TaxID=1549636 RepID=A0ABV2IVK9_9HYPH
MRIVVDTNVFIGACIGRGPASQVIEACLGGKLTPLMSNALYLEYEDVLDRSGIFTDARLGYDERQALFDIFLGKCVICDIYFLWRPNLRDEADNHLMELAVAGSGRCIATFNKRDFLGSELKFRNIEILTPIEIMNRIAQ